jgi:uncharacterized HAD superfamily protein
MKNIILDIDDVTLQYVSALINYLNKSLGKNARKRQIKSWDLEKHYPAPKEEISKAWREFTDTKEFSNLRLIAGAKNGIQELSNYGKIYFVTYRNNGVREKTEENLKKVPAVWKDLIFSDRQSKIDIYRRLNASLVIDDSPSHILEAKNEGIEVLLFNQPWNQELDVGKQRVRNWKEILEYVK